MRIKQLQILLFFVFLLTSCSQTIEKQTKSKVNLKLSKLIKIPIDENTLSYSFKNQVVYLHKNRYLLRANQYKNRLEFYNLDSLSKHFFLQIPTYGPDAFQFVDFVYVNKDTIIVKELHRTVFAVFNLAGKLLKKYNLNLHSNGFIAQFDDYKDYYKNKILYLTLYPMVNHAENPEKFYSENIIMSYDFSKDTATMSDIHYPVSYRNKNIPRAKFYRAYNPITNKFIYSWTYDSHLYIANANTIIKKYQVNSNFLKSIPKFRKYKNWQQRVRGLFSKGSYLNIIYDSYRNVYYRFVCLAGDLEKAPNNLNTPNEFLYRPFSIMLISADFKVLDEIKLPARIFHYYDFFVDKKGLWLSENNPENPHFDENYLAYRLITFSEKN